VTDLISAASLPAISSPAVLFFILGAAASFARSDLSIPANAAKMLSLYLMLCIGFKGGAEARAAGLSGEFAVSAGLGLALSALMPLAAYGWLRRTTPLDRPTAGALAAACGSVSVVTFIAGSDYLTGLGAPPSGYMTAVMAIMETPAILTALLLINHGLKDGPSRASLLHEVFLNAAAVILVGSFLIGLASGEDGMNRLSVFTGPLFQGALCLFLLDLGLTAARGLMSERHKLTLSVAAFALAWPVFAGALGLGLAQAAGLAAADAAIMAILAASASYIAVPAAMRLAAPDADLGVYVTAPLALTFPVNLIVGIPLIAAAAGVGSG
jgi:hypothetical protein